MKFRYLSLGVVAFGFVIGGAASPASADVPGGSGCQGSATWLEDGLTVVAETDGGPYTIPRSDTVSWEGSVTAAPGVYSGSVMIDMPPGFSDIKVDDWGGNSQNTSNSGVHEYDFPSIVPAGLEFTVIGEHSDENGGCSGSITFVIAGGAFDSPLTFAALGATAVFAILSALALKPLFAKVI